MKYVKRLRLRDEARAGRLRDYRGNLISVGRLLRNGPRATGSTALRLALGRLPSRPWISYDGQSTIDRFLSKAKHVLEFGSGMSTRWYAERAGSVLSLEDNLDWFVRIHSDLATLGNVAHIYCESTEEYLALGGAAGRAEFDLIMIDGTARHMCLQVALGRLASGGMLYLDNSDMHGDHVTGDIPAARAQIHEYASQHGLRVETITDFAPAQFFVNEATILFK